jgi:long-subunit fatty acid transport protein
VARAQGVIEPAVVNPGARSLGFGGAFVAIADDATAAYANPAGLVQLVRPEISFEARSWGGDQEGSAANVSGIGFGSFVLPRQRWSLAVYGQTVTSLEYQGGDLGNGGIIPILSDLTVVNAGLSAGWRVGESVSLGLGLTYLVGSFSALGTTVFPIPEMIAFDSESNQSGFIAGVLWDLSDAWSLGLAHRSGADFEFDDISPADRQVTATLPDVTAVGARWRSPGGQATVAIEVEQLAGTDDRTRLHVGGEWVFLSSSPLIGLRAGLWRDPGDGARSSPAGGLVPDEDAVHGAAGIGLAFKRFQIDLGVDVSRDITTASVSGIVVF